MPGAMHRMGVYFGLLEDEEYADTDGYNANGQAVKHAPVALEEYTDKRFARPASTGGAHALGYAPRDEEPAVHYAEEVERPTYQITALHPRTYNEARQIGEAFRGNTPVIMNLSDMDDADAKRLVDFAAGLTFGLHGRIERVTAKVFLLSPHNVSVTAQDKARIENGFFNQS